MAKRKAKRAAQDVAASPEEQATRAEARAGELVFEAMSRSMRMNGAQATLNATLGILARSAQSADVSQETLVHMLDEAYSDDAPVENPPLPPDREAALRLLCQRAEHRIGVSVARSAATNGSDPTFLAVCSLLVQVARACNHDLRRVFQTIREFDWQLGLPPPQARQDVADGLATTGFATEGITQALASKAPPESAGSPER